MLAAPVMLQYGEVKKWPKKSDKINSKLLAITTYLRKSLSL